jgi:hypothetical protein
VRLLFKTSFGLLRAGALAAALFAAATALLAAAAITGALAAAAAAAALFAAAATALFAAAAALLAAAITVLAATAAATAMFAATAALLAAAAAVPGALAAAAAAATAALSAVTAVRIPAAVTVRFVRGDGPVSSVHNIEQALPPLAVLIINPAPRLGVVAAAAAREARVAVLALPALHLHGAVAPLRLLLVGVTPWPVTALLEALVVLSASVSAGEVAHGASGRVAADDGHSQLAKAPAAPVGGSVTPRPVLVRRRARLVRHRPVQKREVARVSMLRGSTPHVH